MRCNYCDSEARGTCRFCGSGVCRDHMTTGRFVSGIECHGSYPLMRDYVVVENAIWCGRCAAHPPSTTSGIESRT